MRESAPIEKVSELMRQTAAEIVLPRFRNLQDGDVREKAPGDVVTVVDRDAEAALTAALRSILPGSRVVGEEAASADPAILGDVDRGWVWVVDPLDGTASFVAGRVEFAMMVGLLRDGEPVAGWLLAPVSGRLCAAERGAGAWVDGARFTIVAREAAGAPNGGGPAGVALTGHLPPELKRTWAERAAPGVFTRGSGVAGVEYPALALGRWGFLFFWRTLPWDHIPGTLFVREAGGQAARLDGSPYRPGDGRDGLLVAPSEEHWRAARALLPI